MNGFLVSDEDEPRLDSVIFKWSQNQFYINELRGGGGVLTLEMNSDLDKG